MLTPSIFYIFTAPQWAKWKADPKSVEGKQVFSTTDNGRALRAHHDGLIVAYMPHDKYVQIVPHGWREITD